MDMASYIPTGELLKWIRRKCKSVFVNIVWRKIGYSQCDKMSRLFFNIEPFTQWKFAQYHTNLSKFCQILNIPLKIANAMKFFAKSGHTVYSLSVCSIIPIDIYRNGPPIGPASLPLLIILVMLLTAIKHALALYAGPVYRFAPACSAMALCSIQLANYSQLAVYFS